jgi:ribosomal protein S18 acetylase RimI-like enzyme
MSKSKSNKFYDPLTNMYVSKSNIEAWNKKLKYTHSAPNHFLENIDIVFDKKEKIDVKKQLYYEKIKMFINNNSEHLLNNLITVNKSRALIKERRDEYNEIMRLYNKSMKEYQDNRGKNIVIRLVLNKNKDKFMAYLQYYNYKKLTKDTYTPDSLIREIDDLILKNRLYGLYSDDLMVGFLIVRKSRYFKIDNMSDKVDTFYIQEVYIDKSMRGRKLGKILLDYALLICPINKKYVSLMTYEGNIMANIAVSYGFELQNEESECPVNKLFFIRKMTDNDFIKNTNRITKSSY